MIESIKALGIWLLLGPVFYSLGRFLSQKWLRVDSSVLKGIFYTAFGLGAIGYFIIAVGTCGFLRIEIVWSVLGLLFVASLRILPEYVQWLRELIHYLFLKPASGFCVWVRVVFLISIILSLLSSLVPEIANDSLAYHLNLPKIFIEKSSILPLLYDEKSYRSLFLEELFIIPMFFKNVPATIFFHWLTTFLVIAALIVWIEEQSRNYACALFFGVLLWLTPTLFNQVAISYSDGAVAFFAFLGFYLLQRGWETQRYKADFFLGGLLMGLSISTKYLTLMMCAAIGVALIFVFFLKRTDKKFLFTGMLLLGAGVFLTTAYWFIRNYVLTGDFLYPLITQKFGTTGLYADQKFSQIGVPKNILSFFSLPYLIAVFPDLFNRHHWVGPAYMLIIPAAFLTLRDPKVRPVLIIAFVSTVLWFISAQDIRFLLSAFPLWVGLAGLAVVWAAPYFSMRLQQAGKVIAIATLCAYLALGFYHYRLQFLAVVQRWTPDVFLTRLERSYPAAVWANQNLPKDARVLNAMEVRSYYFNAELIDSSMFYRIHYKYKDATPDVTIDLLRKQGITHVMRSEWIEIPRSGRKSKNSYDFLDAALKDRAVFKKLTVIESKNIREDRYLYTFYELIKTK